MFRRAACLSLGAVFALQMLATDARSAAGADAPAAAAAFKGYLDALAAKDGAAVAAVVTDGTLSYYERMRIAALEAPAKDVRALGVMDQIMVIILRAKVEPRDLRRWNATELLSETVRRGFMGASIDARVSLGKVAVRGPAALAKVSLSGKTLPFVWHFQRERGAWKNDLVPFIKFSESALRKQLQTTGTNVTEYVHAVAEGGAGRQLPPRIWEPPTFEGQTFDP